MNSATHKKHYDGGPRPKYSNSDLAQHIDEKIGHEIRDAIEQDLH